MANRIISDLIGTMRTFFKIGTIRLKDNSSSLEVRDAADSAFGEIGVSQVALKGSTSGETLLIAAAEATDSYTLPAADGSADQVLQTDGSGALSWATVATGNNAVKSETEAIAFNSSSPIAIFTPPASAVIQKVIVDIDTAFDATTPSISVGIAGETSKYFGATDVDLATAGIYEVSPMYQEDATPDEIIITFAAGTGGSAGAGFVTVVYANPG